MLMNTASRSPAFRPTHHGASPPRGFALLEALIALLIIAIGLLGVAGLQVRAQQAEIEAYQRSQALILLDDLANRIAVNRSIGDCYLTDGFVGSGAAAEPCAGFSGSARRDRANADMEEWVAALDGTAEQIGNNTAVGSITGARGCVTAGAVPNVYVISVAWQGMNPTVAPANGCASGQYGAEDLRRVVSTTVRFADLSAN